MENRTSEYTTKSPEIFVVRDGSNSLLLDVRKTKVYKKPSYYFDALGLLQKEARLGAKSMEEALFEGGYTKDEVTDIATWLGELDKGDKVREENKTDMRAQLIISNTCNLSCTYCRLPEENPAGLPDSPNEPLMSFEQAKKSVDYMMTRKPDSVHNVKISLTPGVGEPLCNLDTIEKLVKYCDRFRDDGVNFTFYFATNATLLDDENIRRITSLGNLNVYISIDGNKQVHDTIRKTRGGSPTYEIVVKNAKKLLSEKNPRQVIGASAVLTAIDTNFDEIYQNLINIGFDYIAMRPVRACPNLDFGLNEKNMQGFKSGYDRLCDMFKRTCEEKDYRYLLSLAPNFDFFARPFYVLLFEEKRYHRCPDVPAETKDISNFNLAFDANGDIAFPCRELTKIPEFRVGNVNSGKIDEEKIRVLSIPDNESIKVCADSWERYICGGGGGCYSAQYFVSGSIYQPDPAQCELIRHVTKSAMKLLVDIGDDAGLVYLLRQRGSCD